MTCRVRHSDNRAVTEQPRGPALSIGTAAGTAIAGELIGLACVVLIRGLIGVALLLGAVMLGCLLVLNAIRRVSAATNLIGVFSTINIQLGLCIIAVSGG